LLHAVLEQLVAVGLLALRERGLLDALAECPVLVEKVALLRGHLNLPSVNPLAVHQFVDVSVLRLRFALVRLLCSRQFFRWCGALGVAGWHDRASSPGRRGWTRPRSRSPALPVALGSRGSSPSG